MASLVDYKLMVRIMALNGASPVLRVIAADVLGLGTRVDAIGAKFGKMRLAVIGVGAAVAGIGVAALAAEYRLAKMGDQLVQTQQRLRGMGVSSAGVSQIYNASFRASQAFPYVSLPESFRVGQKMQTIFQNPREAAAATHEAVLADAVLKNLNITGGAGALLDLVKAAETTGGMFVRQNGQMVFSVQRATGLIDLFTRGLITAQGALTPAQLRQTVKQAAPAAQLITPANLVPLLVEGAQVMGPTFGRGLNMAFRTLLGGMAGRAHLEALVQSGLVGAGSIRWFRGSSQGYIAPGGLRGQAEFTKNPLGWVRDVLVPTLTKHGYKTTSSQVAELYRIFPQTAARTYGNMITNMPAYLRTAAAMRREPSLTAQYRMDRRQLGFSAHELHSTWDSFLSVLGKQGVDPLVGQLHELTAALKYLKTEVNAHPGAARGINAGILYGGEGLVAAGGTAALLGIGGAIVGVIGATGLLVSGFVGLGVVVVLLAEHSKTARDNISAVVQALTPLGHKLEALFGWMFAKGSGPQVPLFAHGGPILPLQKGGFLDPYRRYHPNALHNPLAAVPHSDAAARAWLNPTLPLPPAWGVPLSRKAAVPGNTHSTGDEPVHVIVDNIHQAGASMSHSLAKGLQQHPVGPISHNGQRGFTPPGIGTGIGVLVQ